MPEPIQWDSKRKDEATRWLDFELRYALASRSQIEKKWRDWLEQYRAPAIQPIKHFPFEGAANFVLPITAVDVDQLYAKFMQTIHAADELWSVTGLNEDWENAAKPMQDFLTWLDHTVLKMYQVNQRALLEMVKLGTAIYKHGWLYESRPILTYDDQGKITRVQKTRSQPFVDHVRLNDFIIPPYAINLQPDEQGGAPWIAERIRVQVDRLRSMAEAQEPYLPNIDQEALNTVLSYERHVQTEYDLKVQDMDYVKRARRNIDFDKDAETADSTKATAGLGTIVREVEIFEIHARFTTRTSESQDDIILWYHLPTRSIIRGVYQYYLHGARPYEVIRYFPGEGFYGIGVCEQKEVFQRIQSELYNYQQDNVLLANSSMLAAREGGNIAPNEPLWPGKVLMTVGDPNTELRQFKMADIYPSLPGLINQVQTMGERRTGISDLQVGNIAALPGRTPAQTMQVLLQEGNRRPDLTIKDMRNSGLAKLGLRIIQLLQQFIGSPVDVDGKKFLDLSTEVLGPELGGVVAQKLSTPLQNAELGLGVTLTATSGSANKEAQKDSNKELMALMSQIYPQYLQAMQVFMAQPTSPMGALSLSQMKGMNAMLQHTLELSDFRNIHEILPDISAAEAYAQQAGAASQPLPVIQGRGGQFGAAQGINQLAGLAEGT